MISEKSQPLNGAHNKRLNNADTKKNEGTAAWTNVDEIIPETNVTVPSYDCVEDAKEWVDNGSRL